jgi:hypothetical protein
LQEVPEDPKISAKESKRKPVWNTGGKNNLNSCRIEAHVQPEKLTRSQVRRRLSKAVAELRRVKDMPPVQPRASAEPIMKEYTPVLCPKEARAQEDEGADYAPACDSELVSI